MSLAAAPTRVLQSFPHKIGAARICTTAWYQAAGAAEAGADLFLVKPDDLGLIVPSVERFLKGDPDQASSRTTSGTFAA